MFRVESSNRSGGRWEEWPRISELEGCQRCVRLNQRSCSACWVLLLREVARDAEWEDEEIMDRELEHPILTVEERTLQHSYYRRQEEAIRRTMRSASTESTETETETAHSRFDSHGLLRVEYRLSSNQNNIGTRRTSEATMGDVKATISVMPTVMAIDDEDCTICWEGFQCVFKDDEGSTAKQTPCGHVYHQNCIAKWLSNAKSNPSCPLCRYPLLIIP